MDLQTYGRILSGCTLFQDVCEEEFPEALSFLDAAERSYRKNEMVFMIGEPVKRAGIVLTGIVELSFLDEGDNSITMNHFSAGNLFGESLSCAEEAVSPVQMRALTDCSILFLDLKRILTAESLDRGYQSRLGSNLLRNFARQNVFLNQKVRIMGQRKLRDKIKIFLRQQKISPEGTIRVRFNRNQLAEFLGVNRSALSRELSAMQEEGLLEADGNRITILRREFLGIS